jgi:hypothetical protein
MAYCDSLRFLRGLILLAGDTEEVADLRSTLIAMEALDQQLELIAHPQQRLNLNGEEPQR